LLAVCTALGAGFVMYRYVSAQRTAQVAPQAAVAAPVAVNAAGSPVALPPAQSADQKIRALERQITTATPGAHAPISVTFTEAELNAKLRQQAQETSNLPLENPTIALSPGVVMVSGVYTGSGMPRVPIGIGLHVTAQDGSVAATVQSVEVSGLPVPIDTVPQVRDRISSVLQQSLNRQSSSLPVYVTDVRVGVHNLTVEGTTK